MLAPLPAVALAGCQDHSWHPLPMSVGTPDSGIPGTPYHEFLAPPLRAFLAPLPTARLAFRLTGCSHPRQRSCRHPYPATQPDRPARCRKPSKTAPGIPRGCRLRGWFSTPLPTGNTGKEFHVPFSPIVLFHTPKPCVYLTQFLSHRSSRRKRRVATPDRPRRGQLHRTGLGEASYTGPASARPATSDRPRRGQLHRTMWLGSLTPGLVIDSRGSPAPQFR
jgi:hypothetical protein